LQSLGSGQISGRLWRAGALVYVRQAPRAPQQGDQATYEHHGDFSHDAAIVRLVGAQLLKQQEE